MYFKDTLNTNQEQVEGKLKEEIIVEEYTADLKQLPTTQAAIDSIGMERNKAYYQLGIYKESLKNMNWQPTSYSCCKNSPEENFPAMYNLYK
jgi:hypothetical protein